MSDLSEYRDRAEALVNALVRRAPEHIDRPGFRPTPWDELPEEDRALYTAAMTDVFPPNKTAADAVGAVLAGIFALALVVMALGALVWVVRWTLGWAL